MGETDRWPGVDRTALSVTSLSEPSDEADYWAVRTPAERLQALERIRQAVYGYDVAAGLQRVLEVTQLVRR